MPLIVVQPGVAERIALMDRYRLHDEERKLMMAKPRVWVEELPEEDATSEIPADDASGAPTTEPAPLTEAAESMTAAATTR